MVLYRRRMNTELDKQVLDIILKVFNLRNSAEGGLILFYNPPTYTGQKAEIKSL